MMRQLLGLNTWITSRPSIFQALNTVSVDALGGPFHTSVFADIILDFILCTEYSVSLYGRQLKLFPPSLVRIRAFIPSRPFTL